MRAELNLFCAFARTRTHMPEGAERRLSSGANDALLCVAELEHQLESCEEVRVQLARQMQEFKALPLEALQLKVGA